MVNRLHESTSPYLLQHADNPVHWQPWDDMALAQAVREDKPILLSIGYAACHWCHVMAHESFENQAVAGQMNRDFVNIKVDREERPDIDQLYMNALQLMGEQGGWPLTMFLAPDGVPFFGGTYYPPEPRYGRPSFAQLLTAIKDAWESKREQITAQRQTVLDSLTQVSRTEAGEGIALQLGDLIAERLLAAMDGENGGMGGAPKFPQAPVMSFLWHNGVLRGEDEAIRAVLFTLGRMSQGGIYDHLGGGFARYSVDARWLVPHFEKMLYDNGQLLDLLARGYLHTESGLFAQRIEETVGWLAREMWRDDGGFAAALDADSEGEEGKYYVWSAGEIDALLGADAPGFKQAYDVTAEGNFEGATILNRLHQQGPDDATTEALLARCRTKLLEARQQRVPPARDDKLLADWNGLAITGLVMASIALNRTDWHTLALRAFDATLHHLAEGERLYHSYRAGRRLEQSFLDDYAMMSRAALDLYGVTGEARLLDQAVGWAATVERDFADDEQGGYFFTAAGEAGLLTRSKTIHDGPTPSGNAVMLEVLARLYQLTGDDAYRARAERQLRAFAGTVGRVPSLTAALLQANISLKRPASVVVVGPPDDPDGAALAHAAHMLPLPQVTVQRVSPEQVLPSNHVAHGKTMQDGRPTAYLCQGPQCSLPVTTPAGLRATLASQDGA